MAKVMTTRPKVVKLPPIAEKGRLNLIGKFVFQKGVYLLVEYGLKSKVHKGHGLSRISGISFNNYVFVFAIDAAGIRTGALKT